MARRGRLSILALGLSLPACADADRSFSLVGGRYVDVLAGTVHPNGVIEVREGKITAVLPPGAPAAGDLPVVRADGMTILPGLWDNHGHLLEHDQNESGGTVPRLWSVYRGAPHKREAFLEHGVTTVRDPGGAHAILDIRDRARAGAFDSPRIFTGGKFFTAEGGYPAGVVPFYLLDAVAYQVDDPEEARAGVREAAGRGVDFIKVLFTSGSLRPGEYDPGAAYVGELPEHWFQAFPLMRVEVLSAIVEEAHALGLQVNVHLDRFSEAELALEAGADYLNHAWPVPEGPEGDAFFAEMAERRVCWGPTLGVYASRVPELSVSRFRAVERAHAAGVPITASTDTGSDGNPLPYGEALLEELRFMHRAGMPPIDVLRAATIVGAACLGVADETGSIDPGKAADLVLVDGDPVADLGVLVRSRIKGVWVGGRRVVDRP